MQKVIQFFLVFSICINVSSQNARIVIDIRSDVFCEKGTMVYFNRSDMDESGIGFKKITAKKGITNTFISCSEPFYCYLEIRKGDSVLSSSSSFLITNSVIKVEFDMNKKLPVISGGENDYFFKNRFLLFDIPASIMRYPGFSIKKIKEDYDFQSDDIRLKVYFNEYQDNIVSIVKSKRNYYVVLQALWNKVEYMTLKTLETCYYLFTDTLKRTRLGKTLENYIINAKKIFPGKKIPGFSVLDLKNDSINHDVLMLRDKFTFIEFWASWCVPCREQLRELKSFFSLIDTSKVSIISISIDAAKVSWQKASKEDKFPWTDYLAPGGWQGEVAAKFNLTYIPQNMFLDSNAFILASNITIDQLKAILKEKKLLKE